MVSHTGNPERNERPERSTGVTRPHVLIADEDEAVRGILARMFVADGFEVTLVPGGESLVEALDAAMAEGSTPDILLVDHMVPGYAGLKVISVLRTPFDPRALHTLVSGWVGERRPTANENAAWLVDDMDALHCVSCGARTRLSLDAYPNQMCLCASCRERAAPAGDDDEIGSGD